MAAASFDTTVSAFGNNAGIVVPPEVLEQLGAGKRPPVSVSVEGHSWRTTIGSMKGQSLISVNAATRKETGLAAGDAVHVELEVDASPREVEVPAELAAALDAEPAARTFFDGLSNSLQRYHADQVASAKAPETRARRVAKAVDLFLAGRSR